MWSWIKTVIILPFNVIVIIPLIVLYFTHYTFTAPAGWQIAAGGGLLVLGLLLALWTMFLFATIGDGTAAPWNPPKNIVVKGPYRYVRNPMITSVLIMLAAESLVLSSPAVAGVIAAFWLVNIIYFPLFEEKDLIKRFGDDYILYKNNVPRWIPRLTPWDLPRA
jgi:protein-S-isoprenylcysteine O-methyltransferase Ste14